MADEPVKVVLPKATFDRVCDILSASGHADLVRKLRDEVEEEKGVERGAPKLPKMDESRANFPSGDGSEELWAEGGYSGAFD